MKKILLTLSAALIFLSGCSSNIMSSYTTLTEKNHHYVTKQYTEIMDDLENKVPGVYYFGFPDCPWCKVLVPEFETVLNEYDMTALAVDTRNKQFTNNEILQKRYADFLETFQAGKDSQGSVPFIVVISKDGIVDGHSGLTPDYRDIKVPLTDEQRTYFQARVGYLLDGLK